MVTLEKLEEAAREGLASLDQWLLGIDAALSDWPAIEVAEAASLALRQGREVRMTEVVAADQIRIYGPGRDFVGIGHLSVQGILRPTKIFRR